MAAKWTILVVDDEPDVCNALRRSLRSGDYEVLVAYRGAEALEVMETMQVDAIISDHNMPEMDGLDLLQQTRILYPHVVRFLLTARGDLQLAVRALNEGAVHRFLLKPWDRIDLQGTLALALHSLSPKAAGHARGAAGTRMQH